MKRFHILVSLTVLCVLLAAVPALAEGYNDADGSGAGVTGFYTRATGYASGPHGDYTTTTNKCQDCHSTHYAAGSFMLLRANSREAACDYCHGGGGGSTVNIMMDNTYRDGAYDMADVSADTTTTRGLGTGHTLGYEGNAPADTNPAYSDSEGLACFDCHTPHGNSARVLATFANPGHALFDVGLDAPTNSHTRDWVTQVGAGTTKIFTSNAVSSQTGTVTVSFDDGAGGTFGFSGSRWLTDAEADLAFESTTYNGARVWILSKPKTHTIMNGTYYGFTPQEQNLVANVKSDGIRGAANGTVEEKPIFPSGRWLLIANPDAEGGIADTVVSGNSGVAGTGGVPNKYAIQWATKGGGGDPLGPADKLYGGNQDADNDRGVPTAANGINMVSEFCTDCHDGTAGASTQAALVWTPDSSDPATGTYETAYSHDTQPRHCYRQMWMGTDTDGTNDNEGPHCRNCHNGATSCTQCHGGGNDTRDYQNQFYSTSVVGTTTPYATAYRGQPNLHTSAVTGLNSKCLDGGFSFPHRTLGKDMLKDELYGVDFDGTTISAGTTRTANGTFTAVVNNYPYVWARSQTSEVATTPAFGAPSESGEQLNNMKAENLDSVCIDCHGDATYYNGDNPAYSYNSAGDEWELLLKGLP